MKKKLYRSNTDKVLGGVCGGVAQYLEIDSTVVRLLWVVACFTSIGVLGYIIALAIIPTEPYYTDYQNYNANQQCFYQNQYQNQSQYQYQNQYQADVQNMSGEQPADNSENK